MHNALPFIILYILKYWHFFYWCYRLLKKIILICNIVALNSAVNNVWQVSKIEKCGLKKLQVRISTNKIEFLLRNFKTKIACLHGVGNFISRILSNRKITTEQVLLLCNTSFEWNGPFHKIYYWALVNSWKMPGVYFSSVPHCVPTLNPSFVNF